MNVDIENLRRLRVAAVHHAGPYNQISQAFVRLDAIVRRAGMDHGPDRPTLLAIYHDDPNVTPAGELRSEAGIVVQPDTPMPGELSETFVPAGRYARVRHRGPYERLGDMWSRFWSEWLPASGHRAAAGPSFEIYRNTPMDTPNDRLETDLYVPVAD